MELASMLAGERFSDHPKAVCPVIGAFLRCYNDGIDDTRRQDLLPIAAVVVGTARTRADRARRARICQARIDGRPADRARLLPPSGKIVGELCARALLDQGAHAEALQLVRRLASVGASDDASGGVIPASVPVRATPATPRMLG